MSDVTIQCEGTISLFHLNTDEAKGWVEDNVEGDSQFFGSALVVEHRYVDNLIYGMTEDGLSVA